MQKAKLRKIYTIRERDLLVLSQTYIIVTFQNSSSSAVLRYVHLHVNPFLILGFQMTSPKFKLINYREVLVLTARTHFRFERVLCFAIEDDCDAAV